MACRQEAQRDMGAEWARPPLLAAEGRAGPPGPVGPSYRGLWGTFLTASLALRTSARPAMSTNTLQSQNITLSCPFLLG